MTLDSSQNSVGGDPLSSGIQSFGEIWASLIWGDFENKLFSIWIPIEFFPPLSFNLKKMSTKRVLRYWSLPFCPHLSASPLTDSSYYLETHLIFLINFSLAQDSLLFFCWFLTLLRFLHHTLCCVDPFFIFFFLSSLLSFFLQVTFVFPLISNFLDSSVFSSLFPTHFKFGISI